MSIPAHPYAALFPMMSEADGLALRSDMQERGQRQKIILLDGQILDGRNRQEQLEALGWVDGNVPPEGSELWISRYRRFVPAQDGDPLAFVLSLNLHRRHLTDGQRAMVAERLANMRQGERTDLSAEPSANLQKVSLGQAAEMLHVSERSVASARTVREQAAPELIEAVERGDVPVSVAEAAAKTMSVGDQIRALQAKSPREFSAFVRERRRDQQVEKKERRQEREAELGARQVALPDKRYGVILADPEWQFTSWSADTGMDRAPDNHYPTSPTEVIAARPVASIAADDSVLLLWATAPRLPDALHVLAAWGFEYVTHVVWGKDRVGAARGPGYWFTGEHELVLLGKRGKVPAPAQGTQFRSLFHAAVGAHSEKPTNIHEIAEAYFPNLPKIELNARQRRDGWDAWGLEVPAEVHAASETIAMSFEEAKPILIERYATSTGEELAAITGRPVGTIKSWAYRLQLTERARLAGNASHLGDKLNKPKGETA